MPAVNNRVKIVIIILIGNILLGIGQILIRNKSISNKKAS